MNKEDNITLSDIPFTYLVGWQKANKGSVDGLSYLKTLSMNPAIPDNLPWGEVVHIAPAGKSMQGLLSRLSSVDHLIVANYLEETTSLVLPLDACRDSGFYEQIKAFVRDYLKEMEFQASRPGTKHLASLKNRIHVFRESFEYSPAHADAKDRGEIASEIGCKRQRVDQLLGDTVAECKTYLNGGRIGRVTADPALVQCFREFSDKIGKMCSVSTFRRESGIPSSDGRTMEFLVSVLGMRRMTENGIPISVVAVPDIFSGYRKQIGKTFSFFRNEVIGIRTGVELEGHLNRIGDTTLRESMRSLILGSEEFVRYADNGEEAVTLRWDLLQTISARLSWILYEKKAFDIKSAVKGTDLVKEYNALARRYKEDKIEVDQIPSPSQTGECWRFMALGKTGFWKLRSSRSEDYDFDGVIRDYLTRKGTDASFNDFLSEIKADGQFRLFKNEGSVRSRYLAIAGSSGEKKTMTISSKVILDEVERNTRKQTIVDLLEAEAATLTTKALYAQFFPSFPDTKYGTFSMWVRDLYKDGRINCIPGKGNLPTYVSAKSVATTVPRSEADDICDMAFSLLKEEMSHSLPTKDVYRQIESTIPIHTKSGKTFISNTLHADDRFVFSGPTPHRIIALSPRVKLPPVKAPAAPSANTHPSLDISRVKSCLMKEFTREFTTFGFDLDKAIDNMIRVFRKEGEITDSFSFYDLLVNLPRYYDSTLEADRKRSIRKDSLSMDETFLKDFSELAYGIDVVNEIKQDWNVKTIGLSTICSYLENRYGTLPYKAKILSYPETDVKRMVNYIVESRNKLTGHPENQTDTSKFQLDKAIHDSFFVVLYVAEKLQ